MLTVIKTTDSRFVGLNADLDPRNPPESFTVGDVVFNPSSLTETAPGKWTIRNPNYTVKAVES